MSSLDHAFFYNSENGDRVYDADSFEHWLKKFFTSGVFTGNCAVSATSGMGVQMSEGYCNVDGKVRFFEAPVSFTLATANNAYDRIDTIVIERNDTDRDITAKVVTGTASASPTPKAPVRANGVYQLVVAQIRVAAGATSITAQDITDKRMDTSVCGYVVSAVQTPDFSELYAQFTAAFGAWFDEMKGQLSEDAAGNLQLQIDALEDRTQPIEKGGTGATTAAAARNALGLGNTTGAVPIANGGTGATTAAEARNALGLGNTTGALPVANGGTGETTAQDAANKLINALGLGVNDSPTDDDYMIAQYVAGGETNKTYYRRKMSALWNYIKSKFMPSGYVPIANGGTGATTAAGARNALGLGNTTGALPIANGGTGATTAAAALTALGAAPKFVSTTTGSIAALKSGVWFVFGYYNGMYGSFMGIWSGNSNTYYKLSFFGYVVDVITTVSSTTVKFQVEIDEGSHGAAYTKDPTYIYAIRMA